VADHQVKLGASFREHVGPMIAGPGPQSMGVFG